MTLISGDVEGMPCMKIFTCKQVALLQALYIHALTNDMATPKLCVEIMERVHWSILASEILGGLTHTLTNRME